MQRVGGENGIVSHHLQVLAWIGAVAAIVNIPLGYAREGVARFSPRWFLYVHLSIPLIAFLRITNHLTFWAVPGFVACAVFGQLVGGRLRRSREKRA